MINCGSCEESPVFPVSCQVLWPLAPAAVLIPCIRFFFLIQNALFIYLFFLNQNQGLILISKLFLACCLNLLTTYSFTVHKYNYVTHEDICDVFSGDTLLAVMAPAGTQLEVPVPEVVCNNMFQVIYCR